MGLDDDRRDYGGGRETTTKSGDLIMKSGDLIMMLNGTGRLRFGGRIVLRLDHLFWLAWLSVALGGGTGFAAFLGLLLNLGRKLPNDGIRFRRIVLAGEQSGIRFIGYRIRRLCHRRADFRA